MIVIVTCSRGAPCMLSYPQCEYPFGKCIYGHINASDDNNTIYKMINKSLIWNQQLPTDKVIEGLCLWSNDEFQQQKQVTITYQKIQSNHGNNHAVFF